MKRTGDHQATVDTGAFQERKTELRQFVHETRDRLRTLSEQVVRFQQAKPKESCTPDAGWSDDEPVGMTPNHHQASLPVSVESPAVPAEPFETNSRTTATAEVMPKPAAIDSGSHAADDPLQRLSEIKKRLARQIENA